MQLDSIYFAPVEWSGTMPMMNWASTGRQVRWILRDPATGQENMDVDWTFRGGDVVKLRLVNERRAFHAMQHPIHIHGQRFLVLAVNGVPNDNLVWKDTVLIPVGVGGGHAARAVESRPLDAALSHRRAPFGGHDDGVHGAGRVRRAREPSLTPSRSSFSRKAACV